MYPARGKKTEILKNKVVQFVIPSVYRKDNGYQRSSCSPNKDAIVTEERFVDLHKIHRDRYTFTPKNCDPKEVCVEEGGIPRCEPRPANDANPVADDGSSTNSERPLLGRKES